MAVTSAGVIKRSETSNTADYDYKTFYRQRLV